MKTEFPNRTIYNFDNLDILEKIKDESIDGICIDPPFNSGRNYGKINYDKKQWDWKDDKARWKWDQDRRLDLTSLSLLNRSVYNFLQSLDKSNETRRSYLTFMAPRLYHMHRILEKSGILFLICDDTEMEYLKVLLDMIFGSKNQINLISYRRSGGRKGRERDFYKKLARNSGYVLLYAKNIDHYRFYKDVALRTAKENEISEKYNKIDSNGKRYRMAGIANLKNRPITSFHGIKKRWYYSYDKMQGLLNNKELAYYDKSIQEDPIILENEDQILEIQKTLGNFNISRIRYPEQINGYDAFKIDTFWSDLKQEKVASHENGGNSGGKTEELIERLLKFVIHPKGKNRSVRILDAFLGYGTTAVVAEKLGYEWIGIDNILPCILCTLDRFKGQPQKISKYSKQLDFFDDPDLELFEKSYLGIKVLDNMEDVINSSSLFSLDTDLSYGDCLTAKNELIELKESEDQINKVKSKNKTPTQEPKSFSKLLAFNKWIEQSLTCNSCYSGLIFQQIEADHIIPKSKGGSSKENNCQILCSGCNSHKGAKDPIVFMNERDQLGIHRFTRKDETDRIKNYYKEHDSSMYQLIKSVTK